MGIGGSGVGKCSFAFLKSNVLGRGGGLEAWNSDQLTNVVPIDNQRHADLHVVRICSDHVGNQSEVLGFIESHYADDVWNH